MVLPETERSLVVATAWACLGVVALAAARGRSRGHLDVNQVQASSVVKKNKKLRHPPRRSSPLDDGNINSGGGKEGITCVVQRCEKAELVLDNAARKVETGRGLVVYVSFAENATKENAQRLARLLIGLNLSTTGRWGDGTKTQSVGAISASGMRQEILVVPQACLTSKVKGKQLRYAAQLSREDGFALYTYFLAEIEQALLDHFLTQAFRNDKSLLEGMCMHFELETTKLQGPYCSFDKRGVPTARAGASDGLAVPLSKSERKAFDKLYRALSERVFGHAKSAQDKWAHLQIEQQAPKVDLISGRFRLIAGTFGNRQGLTIEADCGPSTHVLYV